MEHSLTKFGYDPYAEAVKLNRLSPKDRLKYFSKELSTHELHVVRNHAVSLPYPYWLTDEGKVFTNKEKTIELEIDENERDGYYKIGIPKALRLAQANPNQLVLYYSPTGRASFTDPPHPKYAKPYDIGQLNLLYSDGDRIDAVSMSINQNEDAVLREIFGDKYMDYINASANDVEKIKKFITNPVVSFWSISDFLTHTWNNPDMIIFHSNSFGEEKFYNLNDMLQETNDSLTGKLKSQVNTELIAAQAVTNGGDKIRPQDIDWAYKTMMGLIMRREGVDKIALGGGCGGSIVTSSDIFESFNPVNELQKKSNLSSVYRNGIQTSSENYKDDTNLCHCGKPNEPHFHCPGKNEVCNHPIIVSQGVTKCPACGLEATCK